MPKESNIFTSNTGNTEKTLSMWRLVFPGFRITIRKGSLRGRMEIYKRDE